MEESSGGWRTLLPCRKIPKDKQCEVPVNHVGLLSYLSLTWLDGLMWRSFRSGLQDSTLWTCPTQDGVTFNTQRLSVLWRQEVERHGDNARLAGVLLRYVRCRLTVATLVLLLSCAGLLTISSVLMQSVLVATWHKDTEVWYGVVLAAALFSLNMLTSLLFVATFCTTQIAAGRVRSGALGLLYNKLLHTRQVQDNTVGKMLTVFASDGQRLYDGVTMFPMLIGGPLLALGSTAIAIYLLGLWALLGFLCLLFLFPLQMFAGKMFMKFRGAAVLITDQRVRKMTEYLSNMMFIKMYTWEKPLSSIVSGIRKMERKVLEKVNLSMSIAFITSTIVVATATMVTLIVYVMLGNELNGVIAFTYVIVYSSIQDKMELCTIAVKDLSEFFVAANRIQEVLLLPDYIPVDSQGVDSTAEHIVKLDQATFSWPSVAPVLSGQKRGATDKGHKATKKKKVPTATLR